MSKPPRGWSSPDELLDSWAAVTATSHPPSSVPPRGQRPLAWVLPAMASVIVVAVIGVLVVGRPSPPQPTPTPTITTGIASVTPSPTVSSLPSATLEAPTATPEYEVDATLPLEPPTYVFQEPQWDEGGPPATWKLEPLSSIDASNAMRFRLTLQLAPAASGADGPLVLFWQIAENQIVGEEADRTERLLGPPRTVVLQPICDQTGACEVTAELRADFTGMSAYPPPTPENGTYVALAFTAVRSWNSGKTVQTIVPAGYLGSSGTLAEPASPAGDAVTSLPFSLADASRAEIEWYGEGDGQLDYGPVVRELLDQVR